MIFTVFTKEFPCFCYESDEPIPRTPIVFLEENHADFYPHIYAEFFRVFFFLQILPQFCKHFSSLLYMPQSMPVSTSLLT